MKCMCYSCYFLSIILHLYRGSYTINVFFSFIQINEISGSSTEQSVWASWNIYCFQV